MLLRPVLAAQKTASEKTSPAAASVMERLSKGEDVAQEEIYQVPEIAAVRSKKPNSTADIQTPERQRLRRDVLDCLFARGSYTGVEKDGDGGYNGIVKQERRADIVIGVPAAGKSSVLVNPLSQQHGSRIIDSDMAKELLPEYDGGKGAGDVHRESSMIRDELLVLATDRGDNIVWPQVGKNLDALIAAIQTLKDKGYQVYLHLNELPAGKAAGRAINRFLTEGRYVDPGIVLAAGDAPTRNYETLRKIGGLLDGYSRYSNDVPRGTDPRLVEQSESGTGASPASTGGASLRSDTGGLRRGREDGFGGAQEVGGTVSGPESGPGAQLTGVGAAARGFAGPYDQLQGQSAAFHPDGENPARQVDVPIHDFDGRNIPKSAATVMEAQMTPDELIGEIQDSVARGVFSFDANTDEGATDSLGTRRKGFRNFNPRSPCGERHPPAKDGKFGVDISIRAPRKESDR